MSVPAVQTVRRQGSSEGKSRSVSAVKTVFRQTFVAGPLVVRPREVDGRHDGVGGAGGAEKGGVLAERRAVHAGPGEQHGGLPERGHGLVHGQHRHVRALLDRRGQVNRRKMRSVRRIDEQQLAVGAAQVGKRGQVAPQTVIGGRGEEHSADVGVGDELTLGVLDAQRTRNAERFEQGRGEEIRRDIEQGAAMADRAVHLTVDEHAAAAPDRRAEHGENALR